MPKFTGVATVALVCALLETSFEPAAAAPVGPEFQVNSYTTNNQYGTAVAPDGAGGFVVAWDSFNQDGNSYGVFAQRFDSAGSPNGSEFQVNSYTTSKQYSPLVAPDGAGGFVVVWHSFSQDDPGDYSPGVFGQRFSSSGSPNGSEFQVNSYTTGYQFRATVAPDGSGGFVVAWQSYRQDDDPSNYNFGVFARRFSSSGSPAGSEFQVNSYTTYNQSGPAIAPDGAGGFVVVWTSYNQDHPGGYHAGVFAQRFSSSGSPNGSEFQINSYTTYLQGGPAVVPDNAAFVVAWNSFTEDGDYFGVFAQRFAEPTATSTATTTATETTTASTTATMTNTPTPTSGTAAVCPATRAMGCNVPTRGKLIIKDHTDSSKDKLVWKFGKGPLLAQADFGNPVTTDGYAFCVYDDTTKVIDLTIPAGAPWVALSTKGYQYKDSVGTNDGVTKAKLLGGAVGKSKLQLKGKGTGLALPMTASGTQLLSGTGDVVVQLHGNGDCWETSFNALQSRHKVNSYRGKF